MPINYESVYHKLLSSPQLLRLKDILGFTGLGADIDRRYIQDTAVYYHDLRVAELCLELLNENSEYDRYRSGVIGLVHDYSAFPFRHFARNILKSYIEDVRYSPKQRILDLLECENIEPDEKMKTDILNFSISADVCGKLSAEGKIAISCEATSTVFEDLLLALKYKIISFEEIPETLRENFGTASFKGSGNISDQIKDLTLKFCRKYFDTPDTLANAAREFKNSARKNFIVERVFKENEKADEIAKVEKLYSEYIERNKNLTTIDLLNNLSVETEINLIDFI